MFLHVRSSDSVSCFKDLFKKKNRKKKHITINSLKVVDFNKSPFDLCLACFQNEKSNAVKFLEREIYLTNYSVIKENTSILLINKGKKP